MKGITTIAALPGSGAGCQCALPAQVARRPFAVKVAGEQFQPHNEPATQFTVNIVAGAITPRMARLIAERVMRRNAEAAKLGRQVS